MVSSIGPEKVSDDDLQKLENFVVLMYDRSSAASCVNEARLDLFARKQRTYDAIPPTRAALREHAKRAAYQGGVIWGQATASNPETSPSADWGWIQREEAWKINWTTLPPVFENTYFSFFFRFQKTWLFTFFWNDVSKSRKKSSAKV